jgi:hypothetical protein
MSQIIEVVVSTQGTTTVQTRGFAGESCLAASKYLENALGCVTEERKTDEFHAAVPSDQQLRH